MALPRGPWHRTAIRQSPSLAHPHGAVGRTWAPAHPIACHGSRKQSIMTVSTKRQIWQIVAKNVGFWSGVYMNVRLRNTPRNGGTNLRNNLGKATKQAENAAQGRRWAVSTHFCFAVLPCSL